jgi:hypothetical protein
MSLACPRAAAREGLRRGHKRTLLVTLQGKLAISCAPRSSVPGMCRAQIGCAMNVPWCGWGEGWQALQVFDYKAPRASDNGLKIRVSVVRFRPWPPLNQPFRRVEPTVGMEYLTPMEYFGSLSRSRALAPVLVWLVPHCGTKLLTRSGMVHPENDRKINPKSNRVSLALVAGRKRSTKRPCPAPTT